MRARSGQVRSLVEANIAPMIATVKPRTKAETFEPVTMGHGAPTRIPTGTSVVRPR